jgi:hypothetical protein
MLTGRKPGRYAQTIADRAVLAHLALALKSGDRDAQSHNPAQLSRDEIRRRVTDGQGSARGFSCRFVRRVTTSSRRSGS